MSALVWTAIAAVALRGPAPDGGRQTAPVSLTSVQVTATPAGAPVLVVDANGPLPLPITGTLADPPRIYVDLTGVTPVARVGAVSGDLIARIRIALHSDNPVVTRLVIDLKREAAYTIDASKRAEGRIEIALGPADAASGPTAPKPAPASARASGAPAYAARVAPVMQRLDALRPVLAAIDVRSPVSADRLQTASAEVEALRRLLESIRPPRGLADTHGLLLNACSLASTALSLVSASKDGSIPWNAASAAAGALILIDRAHAAMPPA